MTRNEFAGVPIAAATFTCVPLAASAAEPNKEEAEGVPTALSTRSKGWPDIEVGGAGSGKFPVYGFDGKKYVLTK